MFFNKGKIEPSSPSYMWEEGTPLPPNPNIETEVQWTLIAGGYNYGDNKALADSLDKVIFFDSVVSHNYELTNKVTSYAIEGGSTISDHVQQENDKISMEAIVTNTPMDLHPNNAVLQGENFNRVKLAVELLRRIKEEKQPIILVNEYEILDNMVLTSVVFEQTSATAEALVFKLQFERVRLASAMQTYANVGSGAGAGSGTGAKNISNSTGDPVNKGNTQTATTHIGELERQREALKQLPK